MANTAGTTTKTLPSGGSPANAATPRGRRRIDRRELRSLRANQVGTRVYLNCRISRRAEILLPMTTWVAMPPRACKGMPNRIDEEKPEIMTVGMTGTMKTRVVTASLALALAGVVGCGEATSNAAESQSQTKKAEATKDRGNARFTAAGATWSGNYASARQKEDRLSISASRTERAGDKMKRDQLSLNISGFTGPGHYKASTMSMFVRVSINIPKDKDAPVDAQKTLMDALGDTSNIRLANADIEITSVSDGYVDGRFSIEQPAGTPESTISDGQFHARLRE
jgi:hypothetical protein